MVVVVVSLFEEEEEKWVGGDYWRAVILQLCS